jgi:phosphoheptose isomerase
MLEIMRKQVDLSRLGEAIGWCVDAKKVYVAGNGGSAAIANHLCCDFFKSPLKFAQSLVSNQSVLTMIGNDFGFEHTISKQCEKLLTNQDVLILISSSGKSPNIVAAAKSALIRGTKIIGLTGFDGGELKKLSDISLHVPSTNYGIIEDCHQSIMHIMSQYAGRGQ